MRTARDFRRRAPRSGRVRHRAPAAAPTAIRNLLLRKRQELDLRDAERRVRTFFETEQPEYVFLAAAQGGRHSGEQLLSGRIHLRQSGDPDQRDPRSAEAWRQQALVSRLLLHLSQIRAATDSRRMSADGRAGADQRSLRHRQNRGHQDVPGLPQAVWLLGHQPDADQSVWTRRQFRSAAISHVLPALLRKFHEAAKPGARRR